MAYFITLSTIFMAFISSLALEDNYLSASTISAAPALLPDPMTPLSPPPTLSPDITPLFPSPGLAGSPTESSPVPTIPSSPSPPNPDMMAAPGPDMAFEPSGLLPDSSSIRLNVPGFSVVSGLVAFGLVQLSG